MTLYSSFNGGDKKPNLTGKNWAGASSKASLAPSDTLNYADQSTAEKSGSHLVSET